MANIMLADNDSATIASVTTALQLSEHHLSYETTADGLLKALSKKVPDIIIMGVELDGSDGRTLSKEIRNTQQFKNIPMILASPFFHTESDLRLYCCDALVSTPFDSGDLTDAISVQLKRKRIAI